MSFNRIRRQPKHNNIQLISSFGTRRHFPVTVALNGALRRAGRRFGLFQRLYPLTRTKSTTVIRAILTRQDNVRVGGGHRAMFFDPIRDLVGFVGAPGRQYSVTRSRVQCQGSCKVRSP